jgi:hypothetical protein
MILSAWARVRNAGVEGKKNARCDQNTPRFFGLGDRMNHTPPIAEILNPSPIGHCDLGE